MTNNKPAVLISIKPKWCELIANGAKTIEVRKTRPKLEAPFKCYIYCTKPDKSYQTKCGSMILNNDELYRHPIEGVKHGNSIELMCQHDLTEDNFLNGKVIGEFVCDSIEEFQVLTHGIIQKWNTSVLEKSRLSYDEIAEYIGVGGEGYAWHISDLVIYDEPKELSEFAVVDNEAVKRCEYRTRVCSNPDYTNGAFLPGGYLCSKNSDWCTKCKTKPLTRAPQSWFYVEKNNISFRQSNV